MDIKITPLASGIQDMKQKLIYKGIHHHRQSVTDKQTAFGALISWFIRAGVTLDRRGSKQTGGHDDEKILDSFPQTIYRRISYAIPYNFTKNKV
uniref:SFRICE_003944 n=1 Tax=Spodoptera frugiperda TaxID=7108 RepID=A0A2H1V8W7_SPOFR